MGCQSQHQTATINASLRWPTASPSLPPASSSSYKPAAAQSLPVPISIRCPASLQAGAGAAAQASLPRCWPSRRTQVHDVMLHQMPTEGRLDLGFFGCRSADLF
ncbi:hypothetical protein PAHAL_5G362200 [Panicum hallii]|uniref:Uncharacterized protein n=1 Tax=Panicum hallii TaxID=206008 RepID=A0A2T8IMB3_9POAL|nr:hypothetical protein PAHAL_5G362200 [Panicum hallii]